MRTFFGAVLFTCISTIIGATSVMADDADCCTVTVGPMIVFTEDPIILAGDGVDFHANVDEVYFDAGDCVVFIDYPDNTTSTYPETSEFQVHRLTLSPHVAAHPAFAKYGTELTLSEVATAAAEICSPTELVTN
jgi:hypothetical protein